MKSLCPDIKANLKRLFYNAGIISLIHNIRNRNSLSIIMFHDVQIKTDQLEDSSKWIIGKENFERCLDIFENLYNIISLEDFLMFMSGRVSRLPEKSLLITFDDGLTGQAEIAAQILKSRKLPAHFFLTLGHLAPEKNRHYKIILDTSKLLSEKQIKNLADWGFSIGCHGLTHTPLTEIENEDALKAELFLPLEILKTIIPNNIGVETLSFPHSKYNCKVINYACEVGYKAIFAGGSQLNRISTLPSRKTIARIPIIEGMWIGSSVRPSPQDFRASKFAWWLATLKYV